MPKRIFAVILSVVFVFITAFGAAAYEPTTFSVRAEGCVFASFDTGEILYEKNADQKMYPASLTKIMTAVVVFNECKNLNEIITADANSINILLGTDSSVLGIVEGEQFTVLQLLNILLIHSANDAANILATHFGGGSISAFVDKMNAMAQKLGMTGTHYVNAHGLHDDNHYTTPYDMFVLTKYALENKNFKEIVDTVRYRLPATNKHGARTLSTTNFLQDKNSMIPSYYYKYAAGVKTGYTDLAGRCLISTATKNGVTYLCVIMKSPVTDNGLRVRYEFPDSRSLYQWAFSNFEYRQVYDTTTPVGECPVSLSSESDHVAVLLEENVYATLPLNADDSTVDISIKYNEETVEAPIKKGQKVGVATVRYAGKDISTVNVVAMNDVSRSEILYLLKAATNVLKSKAFRLILAIIVIGVLCFILYCVWLNRARRRRRRRRRR